MQASVLADKPDEFVEQLSSETYETRDNAYAALRVWALNHKEQAKSLLYEKLERNASPETQMRIHEILREIVIYDHFGRPRGFIGIELGGDQLEVDGEIVPVVTVARVIPDSAAATKGLKPGDVIVSLDGKRMSLHEVRNSGLTAERLFIQNVGKRFKGDLLRLGLFKEGKVQEMILTLGERPAYLSGTKAGSSEDEQNAYYEKWLQEQEFKQP